MSLVNLRLIFVITLLIREISISSLLLCPALRRKGNKILGFKFNWTALCSSTERTDRQTDKQTDKQTDIQTDIDEKWENGEWHGQVFFTLACYSESTQFKPLHFLSSFVLSKHR